MPDRIYTILPRRPASLDLELGSSCAAYRRRWVVVILLILTVTVWHWVTPMAPEWMHAIHILLRKLFFLPILLAAIWFGVTGAAATAAGVSIVYLPYVLIAWPGNTAENFNQAGEIATFWIVGLFAGWLANREREALKRVANMSRDALNALVAALDAREHQTERHSHRVANLAVRIGQRLNLRPESLEVIRQASVLHDVGKIGVPDSILLKPGPLTGEERRIMQEHAGMGYNILITTSHLREVAELVLAHHERFDGTGYPKGLMGESVPLGSRIFAVADVYDALTNNRPYREALPQEQALEIIRDQAGKAFDPQVVSAFMAELGAVRCIKSAPIEAGSYGHG